MGKEGDGAAFYARRFCGHFKLGEEILSSLFWRNGQAGEVLRNEERGKAME